MTSLLFALSAHAFQPCTQLLAANADLAAALSGAANNDVICLTGDPITAGSKHDVPVANLTIRGEGVRAVITSTDGGPIFEVASGRRLTLENLTLDAEGDQRTLLVKDSATIAARLVNVVERQTEAGVVVRADISAFAKQHIEVELPQPLVHSIG